MGILCADDFHSGTVSAAFGGTTTIIPFATQQLAGSNCARVVSDYHALAGPKPYRLRVSSNRMDLTPAAKETLPN